MNRLINIRSQTNLEYIKGKHKIEYTDCNKRYTAQTRTINRNATHNTQMLLKNQTYLIMI